MKQPIYYSKVEYDESIGYGIRKSIILLNIPERNLTYQVFAAERQMPAMEGTIVEEWNGNTYTYQTSSLARIIRNGKTKFEPTFVKIDNYEDKELFSYGIHLREEQVAELLPYCNTLDFEPYRDKKMSMDDVGYIGYRDEIRMKFIGVTDSYIPLLELPMDYYYDEAHIWPSERLYYYLVKTFLSDNKKLNGYGLSYGGHSLFF